MQMPVPCRRAGSLRRGGNLRAGSGPLSSTRPPLRLRLLVFCCHFSHVSVRLDFARKTKNIKTSKKLRKERAQDKRPKLEIYFPKNTLKREILDAYNHQKNAKTDIKSREPLFEELGCDLPLRVSFSRLRILLFLSPLSSVAHGVVNLPSRFTQPHCVHSAAKARYLLSHLNPLEHYVGVWAPRVGGRTLAEGEIPCLRCSVPRRVSVGLMYVSSPVSPVLSGACGFLVIRDNR